MLRGIQERYIMLVAAVQVMYNTRLRPKLVNERGDTNFISILIILSLVVILSGVFIGFKDTIVEKVTEIVEKFEIH